MTTDTQETPTPTPTVSETTLRTAGDVSRELGKSVTTIKTLALQTHAPVTRTPGGLWVFTPAAVDKIRNEIERRERQASR